MTCELLFRDSMTHSNSVESFNNKLQLQTLESLLETPQLCAVNEPPQQLCDAFSCSRKFRKNDVNSSLILRRSKGFLLRELRMPEHLDEANANTKPSSSPLRRGMIARVLRVVIGWKSSRTIDRIHGSESDASHARYRAFESNSRV